MNYKALNKTLAIGFVITFSFVYLVLLINAYVLFIYDYYISSGIFLFNSLFILYFMDNYIHNDIIQNSMKKEDNKKMDYAEELKKLGNYWKPKAGQYKVKILSEMSDADPYIRSHEDGREEKIPMFKVDISIEEDKFVWSFGKGLSKASTYGQLLNLAVESGNKLLDKEITVAVKHDGKKNDYTIIL